MPELTWLQKARDALADERFGEAVNYCNQGIAEHPQSSNLYLLRGAGYLALDVYDRAEADYTKAIELDDKLLAAYISRAFIYYELERYDEAVADFTKSIALRPEAVYYNNRGSAYFAKGELDRAEADYSKAIEIEAKAGFYTNRGVVYKEQENYDKAVLDFTQAIKLDNSYIEAYSGRADAYSKQGLDQQAETDYKKALALDVEDYVIWYNLAVHYQLFQHNDAAVQAWQNFLKYAPEEEQETRTYAYEQLTVLTK